MGRAKLRMELIANEKKRVSTFEKRRKGLEKKAHELSTLCGVDMCMIMYGPVQSSKISEEPMVWPRNSEVVSNLIDSYKSKPEEDCRNRRYDLSTFFKDRTEKVEEEIQQVSKKMNEAKYPKWDERYDSLSADQMRVFLGVLKAKIDAVRERIDLMKQLKNQENAVSMQSLYTFQHEQPVAYNGTQDNLANNMSMVMMNNGAWCSQSTLNFNGSYCNNGYDYSENFFYGSGLGAGMMENVGINKIEPLLYNYIPCVAPVPQNGQYLLPSSSFPQAQADQSMDYVQRLL